MKYLFSFLFVFLFAAQANAQPTSVLNSAGATLCSTASQSCPIAVNATGGVIQGVSEVVNIAVASVAYGSVGASYGAALTDAHNKLDIIVDNQTDAAIYVSFDGTNNHEILAAGQAARWQLGAMGRQESGNVYVKRVSGAPTSGAVYVSARY